MPETALKETLISSVQRAGQLALKRFGRIIDSRRKENPSSVVSEVDFAAEECILKLIRARFPRHSIVTEESGCIPGTSEYSWIIDPLDGTSNFVSRLPWFGVQAGILRGSAPVMSAIYLPVEDTLFFAEAGRGAYRNRTRVSVAPERKLSNVLCAFGLDNSGGAGQNRRNCELLVRLSRAVRNIRATNSVVDFCFTLEGRLGGFINLHTKIWDILPISLMLSEAGGKLTDLRGESIRFGTDRAAVERNYEVVGASRALHAQLLRLISGKGNFNQA